MTASLRAFLAISGLLIATGLATQAAANSRGSLTVDARERTYEIHVPALQKVDQPLSLVLVLHNRLGDGHRTVGLMHFDQASEAPGFLAVYPDGLHRGWADGRRNRLRQTRCQRREISARADWKTVIGVPHRRVPCLCDWNLKRRIPVATCCL